MKIEFRLAWARGPVASKHFKETAAFQIFAEYLKRIARFMPASASGIDLSKPGTTRAVRWFCDLSDKAKLLSSEELARALEKIRSSGRDWEIVIGPADGFSGPDLKEWKPDLLWSFGPLTLPHELAAVVAAEQVYRAFTIVSNQPYHSGH